MLLFILFYLISADGLEPNKEIAKDVCEKMSTYNESVYDINKTFLLSEYPPICFYQCTDPHHKEKCIKTPHNMLCLITTCIASNEFIIVANFTNGIEIYRSIEYVIKQENVTILVLMNTLPELTTPSAICNLDNKKLARIFKKKIDHSNMYKEIKCTNLDIDIRFNLSKHYLINGQFVYFHSAKQIIVIDVEKHIQQVLVDYINNRNIILSIEFCDQFNRLPCYNTEDTILKIPSFNCSEYNTQNHCSNASVFNCEWKKSTCVMKKVAKATEKSLPITRTLPITMKGINPTSKTTNSEANFTTDLSTLIADTATSVESSGNNYTLEVFIAIGCIVIILGIIGLIVKKIKPNWCNFRSTTRNVQGGATGVQQKDSSKPLLTGTSARVSASDPSIIRSTSVNYNVASEQAGILFPHETAANGSAVNHNVNPIAVVNEGYDGTNVTLPSETSAGEVDAVDHNANPIAAVNEGYDGTNVTLLSETSAGESVVDHNVNPIAAADNLQTLDQVNQI